MHVRKGRFYGPSRGRAKTQNMARPSAPFEIPFVDPPTIAALKNIVNDILTKIGGDVCCSTLCMYVEGGVLCGGTNVLPGCSHRHDMCLLQQEFVAPKAIGHGANDDLIRQECDSDSLLLAVAKQRRVTLPDAETASLVKIRLAACQVLATW